MGHKYLISLTSLRGTTFPYCLHRLYVEIMFYISMLIGGFSLSLRLVDGQERAAFQKYGFGFAYGNFRQILHHYLSAVKVRSVFTENEDDCAFNCISEPQCYSFNIATNPDSSGLYLCELLITDEYRNAKELRANATFHHWGPWVSSMLFQDLKEN